MPRDNEDDDRRRRRRDREDEDRKRRRRRQDDDDDRKRERGGSSRRRKRRSEDDDDDDDDSRSSSEDDRRRDRKRRSKHRSSSKRRKKSSSSSRKHKRSSHKDKKKRRKYSSSSESSSSGSESDSSSSSSDSSSSSGRGGKKKSEKVVNKKLLEKLQARGETLEERKERRAQKRAAKITARFGYTAEENPFNDPNLHETFTWTKKKEKAPPGAAANNPDTLEEIDLIRKRREERERERDEMDRLKAEESRMKELENYDEWAKKEEEFHLQQQRQRSAIRLVEGRERPIDVLAKNLLLFGLSDEEKKNRAAVKYQEKYNALQALESLEAELDEPSKLLKILKLDELKELMVDIDAFRMLEREAVKGSAHPNNSILQYWDALHLVAMDEVKLLEMGGDKSKYAQKIADIKTIFDGQSRKALEKMKHEVEGKLRTNSRDANGQAVDKEYWAWVLDQLLVHLAQMELSELHSKMLVRQLERLEQKKEELSKRQAEAPSAEKEKEDNKHAEESERSMVPTNVSPDFGNLEEELGLTDEIDMTKEAGYAWQDKYRPRKPRYFNRVKTGYDWNKYNQTHYDHDNVSLFVPCSSFKVFLRLVHQYLTTSCI